MSTVDTNELADVLDRVKTWPTTLRLTLARKIFESLGEADALPSPRPSEPRGLLAAEVRNLLGSDRPPPDDETVKRWIDEHRMEKFGS